MAWELGKFAKGCNKRWRKAKISKAVNTAQPQQVERVRRQRSSSSSWGRFSPTLAFGLSPLDSGEEDHETEYFFNAYVG